MSASKNQPLTNNIKKYKHKFGVSQDHLSKMMDIICNIVVKFELGANQISTIKTIFKGAKGLGVGMDDLIQK